MPKVSKTFRIEEKLIKEAEKIAEENKKEYKTPNTVTAIIEEALAIYIMKVQAAAIDEANSK